MIKLNICLERTVSLYTTVVSKYFLFYCTNKVVKFYQTCFFYSVYVWTVCMLSHLIWTYCTVLEVRLPNAALFILKYEQGCVGAKLNAYL